MKKMSVITLLIAFIFAVQPQLFAQHSEHHETDTTVLHADADHSHAAADHAEEMVLHTDTDHAAEADHSGGHGADMAPLFFIIVALLLGAAVRHLLQKSPLPFTVWLPCGFCPRVRVIVPWP